MRNLTFLILINIPLLCFAPILQPDPNIEAYKTYLIEKSKSDFKALRINYLISAVSYVESRGNILAYNEKEGACGHLQIRNVMLRHVNQISGSNYTTSDCFDSIKSIEMFKIVMDNHNPDYDIRAACRIWNGKGKSGNGNVKYYENVLNRAAYLESIFILN